MWCHQSVAMFFLRGYLQHSRLGRWFCLVLKGLLNVRQVVLHLLWRKPAETIAVADSNLNIILGHLTLKTFLQGQNGSVHCILQLQVFRIPLLQECLAVDTVLAHSSRLPGKVGATWVALEKQRLPRLIPATDEERHSKWPHPAPM